MKVAILVAAITATAWAQTEADASRGPQILKAQNCDRCHWEALVVVECGRVPCVI